LGVGFSARGESWGFSGGAFSRNVGTLLAGSYPQNALTARLTWRPLNGEDGFVHLGAGASFRQLRDGAGVLLSGTAESSLVSGFTPHSPLVTADGLYHLWNLEYAARWKSALLMTEYIHADVSSGPSWSGEYAEAAWALTGERRGYSVRYGTIGGVTPDRPLGDGGYGALELAARWSRTDLRSGGGDLGQIASVGLNWYPVDQVRLSINAAEEHLDLGDGTARNGTLVQARLQLSF
jgi:phosphate-selective porin OprO/OprP